VVAFIQPAVGSTLTSTEVADHAQLILPHTNGRRRSFSFSALPLTPTGKVVKAELIKMAASTQ